MNTLIKAWISAVARAVAAAALHTAMEKDRYGVDALAVAKLENKSRRPDLSDCVHNNKYLSVDAVLKYQLGSRQSSVWTYPRT